jgi:hypothetical protein
MVLHRLHDGFTIQDPGIAIGAAPPSVIIIKLELNQTFLWRFIQYNFDLKITQDSESRQNHLTMHRSNALYRI